MAELLDELFHRCGGLVDGWTGTRLNTNVPVAVAAGPNGSFVFYQTSPCKASANKKDAKSDAKSGQKQPNNVI